MCLRRLGATALMPLALACWACGATATATGPARAPATGTTGATAATGPAPAPATAATGAARPPRPPRPLRGDPTASAILATDLRLTRQAGIGPAFRPPPVGSEAVAAGETVGALRCSRESGVVYGAHLELFAHDRGLVVPAGIGVAPPLRRHGPFVLGGRCLYPLRTVDPTGVVQVQQRFAGARVPTVGQLFALWGQPLSPRRLGAFRAAKGSGVVAFVDGRRWRRDPREIPLRRHAQIVIELGPLVAPHAAYLFPAGL